MDRRKSIKALAIGTVSTGVFLEACKTKTEEKATDDALRNAPKFFTDAEMATITVLANIIIPKDEVSGSASDAKVPEFIDLIVHEKTEHQIPLKGGLRWLDLECINRYGKAFTD